LGQGADFSKVDLSKKIFSKVDVSTFFFHNIVRKKLIRGWGVAICYPKFFFGHKIWKIVNPKVVYVVTKVDLFGDLGGGGGEPAPVPTPLIWTHKCIISAFSLDGER
jgi:hypothetical protein